MFVAVGDIARAFGVDRKTVGRWEESGYLPKAGRVGKRGVRRWPVVVVLPVLVAAGLPVPAEWNVAVAA